MSVTIKDIAKIAGVSHSTVSRSLNDSPLISEKTKNRIKQIAKDLDFQFNANARSLNTKKTGTIGIIYPEQMEEFRVNLYHSSLLSDIRYSLERGNLDSIVTFPRNRFTKESNIKKLINQKKIDGLIIIYADISKEELEFIKEAGIPHIFLHYIPTLDAEDKIELIATDHYFGGKIAAEHLLELGHRKILCLTADYSIGGQEFLQRTEGYRSALVEKGVEVDEKLIIDGNFTFESAYKIVLENKNLFESVTAVFAQNDLMALGVIRGLNEIGFSVPEDISVIGYDDSEMGMYFKPKLTTVHQPREELSKIACEYLIEVLNKKSVYIETPVYKFVKPTLVIRESTSKKK